jgi:hypothetical protein
MANLFLAMAGWRETETYSALRRNQEAMACRSWVLYLRMSLSRNRLTLLLR